MPRFGKRSKERLKGVDAKLVNVLNELIKIMDVTIMEGLRSKERQEELLERFAGVATGILMVKLKIIVLMT